MPHFCAEDVRAELLKQESDRNCWDDENNKDDFRPSWNGQCYGLPQRYYAPRPRTSSTQPFDRASPFDSNIKDVHNNMEPPKPMYTQEDVDERDHQWREIVFNERKQFAIEMEEQRAGEEHRQTEAIKQAMKAVEQKAQQALAEQHADHVNELEAYKKIVAREKDEMEKALKAQNLDLEGQLAALTHQFNGLKLCASQQSKPPSQGGASALPPPLPPQAKSQNINDVPSVPSRHMDAPDPAPAPAPPQEMQDFPAPPPNMHTVFDAPPITLHSGYPPVPTNLFGASSSSSSSSSSLFLKGFSSEGGQQPKYGPFLLRLADLNRWNMQPKSKAGGVVLALASGATDAVSTMRAALGSEGSYVDMAYTNNLVDFGKSPNHSLEDNAKKANMERQDYMLNHWKKFQATRSIFLVKAKAEERIYVATSLSLGLVNVRHEVKCLYQIEGSDIIETRTISIDEIQFYAALKVDPDFMGQWFDFAEFPEQFKTSWNSPVDDIQGTVCGFSNQPALCFLK